MTDKEHLSIFFAFHIQKYIILSTMCPCKRNLKKSEIQSTDFSVHI